MDQLSKEQKQAYSAEIKSFVNSDAFNLYLLPMLMKPVQAELPSPTDPNFERKYIYAFALSTSTALLINSLKNISSHEEYLKKVEEYVKRTGSIDEA